MSGNNYTYNYPPPPPTTYYPPQEKSWNWSNEQQYNPNNFARTSGYNPPNVNSVYNTNANSHETSHVSHSTHINTSVVPPPSHPPYTPGVTIPPQNYYNYNKPPVIRPYRQQQRRFNNIHQYTPNPQHGNWNNRNVGYKRPRLPSEGLSEQKAKGSKKKKKPLSQNIPSKKDWTLEEAEKAFNCEKEYNKRHKNQSLIIKFPDLELNKDIVSKFHPAIENVHFQQPSTARFCFVKLDDSADADTVISEINKIKFGEGFLTAEYKKDREDEQNIGPEDIDPHTLYVGNLAQDITKEDMTKTYPKSKRIDIGYAKKMKYTRYAFVNFKSVDDCVEAFKKTHNTQLYSKSLIVRFRRLHGTVGMPGESKPQNHQKSNDDEVNNSPHDRIDFDHRESTISESFDISSPSTLNDNDDAKRDDYKSIEPNLDLVKKEPEGEEESEEFRNRWKVAQGVKLISDEFLIPHRPKVKVEVKEEPVEEPDDEPEIEMIPPPQFINIVKTETESKSDEEDNGMFSFGGDTSTNYEDSDNSGNEDEDNYMLGVGDNNTIFSRYVEENNIQS